ncbi:MAG: hypothetical protein N0C84_00710 [Candidatus Thiodiazotropha taylori]|uniref:Uncharacterized protein n=1 Tax=Candidatus Thiodiazotropha taylori TaxID=2792791 RepID=A0A9E4K850_9GAMM|nr:hypothetical protein [Candidatus Thiodiazotropha taylori]MCW4254966.1 hypothetical protein [Candidatus Thiodiazotropha taylori]
MKHHNQERVNAMVQKQVRALAIFFGAAVFGFLMLAMNVRWVMDFANPYLMVAVFQLPMAVAGFYLGMVLIQADREKLDEE